MSKESKGNIDAAHRYGFVEVSKGRWRVTAWALIENLDGKMSEKDSRKLTEVLAGTVTSVGNITSFKAETIEGDTKDDFRTARDAAKWLGERARAVVKNRAFPYRYHMYPGSRWPLLSTPPTHEDIEKLFASMPGLQCWLENQKTISTQADARTREVEPNRA